jgi:hypothetical protein
MAASGELLSGKVAVVAEQLRDIKHVVIYIYIHWMYMFIETMKNEVKPFNKSHSTTKMDTDTYILKEFQKSWDEENNEWVDDLKAKLVERGFSHNGARKRIHEVIVSNIKKVWGQWSRLHGTASGEDFEDVELPAIVRALNVFDNEDLTYLKLTTFFLRHVSENDRIYFWKMTIKRNDHLDIKLCLLKFYYFDHDVLSLAFNVIDPEDDEECTEMIASLHEAVFDILDVVRDYEQMAVILWQNHRTVSRGEVWSRLNICNEECTPEQMKTIFHRLNLSEIKEILNADHSINRESFVLACAELFGPEVISNLFYDGVFGRDLHIEQQTLLCQAIRSVDYGLVMLLIKLGADPYHVVDISTASKPFKQKQKSLVVEGIDQPRGPSALDIIEYVKRDGERYPGLGNFDKVSLSTLLKIEKYLESVMTRRLMIYGRNRIQDELHGGSEWRAFKREGGGSGGAASGH